MDNSMTIGGYGFDPYFMQAYMYNNPNYLAQLQAMQALQSQQTSAPTNTAQTQPQQNSKKKDHTAGLIVGTVLTVGAALLCRKAYKVGNGATLLNKMGDGFKSMYNSAKSSITKTFLPDKFTIYRDGERTVCTLPGKTNTIKGANVIKEAEALGISTDVNLLKTTEGGKVVLNDGISISDFVIKHPKYGNITVQGGKLADWRTAKGNLSSYAQKPEARADVKSLIEKILKGENLENIENIRFAHTAADGTIRIFTADAVTAAPKLETVATKYFSLNSPAVDSLRLNNEALDKALLSFSNGGNEGVKPLTVMIDGGDAGKIIRTNGAITEIRTKDGILKAGTDAFDSWHYHNKDLYEEALKKKAEECTTIAWQI